MDEGAEPETGAKVEAEPEAGAKAEPERDADRHPAAAVAALIRVPNLFTAPPDVILGAALAVAAGRTVAPSAVAGLAGASILLYAGGTTLNDAFDAPRDATERPERPIPSGEVSRRAAFALGSILLLAGVAVAVAAAGLVAGAVAVSIAAGILLYDGLLKGGAAGFLTMGSIRGLNVVLGTTVAAGTMPTRWYLPVLAVALYIASVTFMAARETEGDNRFAIGVAAVGVVVAVAAVGLHLLLASPPLSLTGVSVGLAAGFVLWTGSKLRAAYADPKPETVGPAVGTCVVALVLLDAAFAAVTGVGWAAVAVAFLLPTVALSSVFDVT